MGLGDTCHGGWGCAFASFLSMSKWSSKAGKTPCLRTQIRQIDNPSSFLVKVQHWLGSVCEQRQWVGLLFRHCGYEFVCQDLCAGYCKSLPTSLSPSESEGWALQIPLQSLWCEIRVGVATVQTRNAGESWLSHLGSLSLLEELQAQWDFSA